MTITPWWEALRLRDEIRDAGGSVGDVQMSLFHAVHQPDEVPYASVDYYAEITHPTDNLVQLLAETAIRLGLGRLVGPRPVRRGDQGMGGGKSHGLVGLWQMASNPEAFFHTDLGERVLVRARDLAGADVPEDLQHPVVVVLPCDQLAPGTRDQALDGPADSLAERWLWRLFERDIDKYEQHRDRLTTKRGIEDALRAVERPVLVLIDEVLDYLRTASSGEVDERYGVEVAAFLTRLMEAVQRVETAALVLVMISSDVDVVAMSALGERQREELEGKLTKYATPVATTQGGDFADIIRRRLFTALPPDDVVAATAQRYRDVAPAESPWSGVHSDVLPSWDEGRWSSEVARCYPFHPALMDVVGNEWAVKTGFQKVRSTLQVFAAAVWHHSNAAAEGAWVPSLIGLGDLPLDDLTTLNALLSAGIVNDQRAVNNYREIAGTDIVTPRRDRGNALRLDREQVTADGRPDRRVAERMATAMWISSLAPRRKGVVGATERELLLAGHDPADALDLPSVEGVLRALVDDALDTVEIIDGTNRSSPRRYRLSTKQTVKMLYRQQREAVTDLDVAEALRDLAREVMSSGPFGEQRLIEVPVVDDAMAGDERIEALVSALEQAGVDEQGTTRLYVLDPTAFTLLNGKDVETRRAVRAALGLRSSDDLVPQQDEGGLTAPTPLSVANASSAVFAVVNTSKRSVARGSARDWIAWSRVAALENVAADDAMHTEAVSRRDEVANNARRHLATAYQHVLYLVDRPGPGSDERCRTMGAAKFEGTGSALNGTEVWKLLVDESKAFDRDMFSARALLQLIGDNDWWGRPLRELRDAFYKNPRAPLLFDGEGDLRRVVYEAVASGQLLLVDDEGGSARPGAVGEVNLARTDLHVGDPEQQVSEDPPSESSPLLVSVDGTSTGATEGRAAQPSNGSPTIDAMRTTVQVVAQRVDGQDFDEAAAWEEAMGELSSAFLDNLVDFAQVSLKVTFLDPARAQGFARAARQAGATVHGAELDEAA